MSGQFAQNIVIFWIACN